MNQTNGHTDSRYGTARQSLRSVTADTLELAKLQTRLFKLDALESLSKLRSGIILMIAGGLLILATVPVLLVAIGEAFIELAGWNRLAAYSASAGGSILVAAIMMAVAWRQLNRSGGGWQRSMDELQRNMDWLKSTLSGDEATPK